MAAFYSKRVTPEKVLAFLMAGFGIGTVVGYIFMATAHTVRLRAPPGACSNMRGQPVPAHLLEANAARRHTGPHLSCPQASSSLASDAYADAGDPGHVALRRGARHGARCLKRGFFLISPAPGQRARFGHLVPRQGQLALSDKTGHCWRPCKQRMVITAAVSQEVGVRGRSWLISEIIAATSLR